MSGLGWWNCVLGMRMRVNKDDVQLWSCCKCKRKPAPSPVCWCGDVLCWFLSTSHLVVQEGDKQETDRNYENMWRQLRLTVGIGQRVPLINLVCNHLSFAQTVENIFTLSFLVSRVTCRRVHACLVCV